MSAGGPAWCKPSRLLAVTAWVAGMACLVSPPILERPPVLDVRIEFFVDDIRPPNRRTIEMDKSEEDVIDFGINEIRDRGRPDEAIDFDWVFDIDGEEFELASGQLRLNPVRTEQEGSSVYEPVALTVSSCSAELRNARNVTIRLEITDPIPIEQVDPEERRFEFVDRVVWDVQLVNLCP